jgi:hypothetical protein
MREMERIKITYRNSVMAMTVFTGMQKQAESLLQSLFQTNVWEVIKKV